MKPTAKLYAFGLPLMVYGCLCLFQILAILNLNAGVFTYTLDDPYIHLRLAENISQGHYGINSSEHSAPSSSILWPFLLVPFSGLEFFTLIPLILNVLACIGIITIFTFVISHISNDGGTVGIVASLFVLGTALLGLTFTGMEHSLQVFLALLIALGLILDTKRNEVPLWLISVAILSPLIRYESLCLTTATIFYLIVQRRFGLASLCAVLTTGILGAYSWFLYSMGLEILPNSVMAKTALLTPDHSFFSFMNTFANNLLFRQGAILTGVILLLISYVFRKQFPPKERLLALSIALSIGGYLFFVPLGVSLFDRYDMFLVSTTFVVLVYLYRGPIEKFLKTTSTLAFACQATLLLFVVSHPYLGALPHIFVAANNIYEQQYQMKRFAQEFYQGPVAVNDLGLVSYKSQYFVLDLWGLGSTDALRANFQNTSPTWMDRLAKGHDVSVAMIYKKWFPQLPDNWTHVASLHLGRTRMTPAQSTVHFYALNEEAFSPIQKALSQFKLTLPERVRLDLMNFSQ